MRDGTKIEKPVLLLVEGIDEQNFFAALNRHLDIQNIQIIVVNGKQGFRPDLALLPNLPNFDFVQSIGVIRDADDNFDTAFQSLCDALQNAGLSKPPQVLAASGGNPKTSIMILPPQNVGTGRMLEDLCFASVTDDIATPCVEEYFACLKEKEIHLEANVIAKAKIHTFLASRKIPDLRLGDAARKGYWDWNSPVFAEVKQFLNLISQVG